MAGCGADAWGSARQPNRRGGAAVAVADVTAPLPGPAPDLVDARFLLSHLPAPAAQGPGVGGGPITWWVRQVGLPTEPATSRLHRGRPGPQVR